MQARAAATPTGCPHDPPCRPRAPPDAQGENALKIILLGDSACGKSKLVERFLVRRMPAQARGAGPCLPLATRQLSSTPLADFSAVERLPAEAALDVRAHALQTQCHGRRYAAPLSPEARRRLAAPGAQPHRPAARANLSFRPSVAARRQGGSDRLLGHGGAGALQLDAPRLLPHGACVHTLLRRHAQAGAALSLALAFGLAAGPAHPSPAIRNASPACRV